MRSLARHEGHARAYFARWHTAIGCLVRGGRQHPWLRRLRVAHARRYARKPVRPTGRRGNRKVCVGHPPRSGCDRHLAARRAYPRHLGYLRAGGGIESPRERRATRASVLGRHTVAVRVLTSVNEPADIAARAKPLAQRLRALITSGGHTADFRRIPPSNRPLERS